MGQATHIILHCSASDFGDVHMVRRWHMGRGWPDIGYHWVVCNGFREKADFPLRRLDALNGAVQQGIPLDADDFIRGTEIGRHTLGYNDRSIGICLIGNKHFTIEQFKALDPLVKALAANHRIPLSNVIGHCETESGKAQGKTCPNFDMVGYRKHLAAGWRMVPR